VVASSDDEVILSGTAIGQGGSLHLYVVDPRGTAVVADTLTVRQARFERSLDEFDRRGTYQVLVIGHGRDGRFNDDNTPSQVQGQLSESLDQQQTVEFLRDAYSGAGVDDRIVQLSIVATSPSVTISPIGVDDFVAQPVGQVMVSGESNRQPGTDVAISVRRTDNNNEIASATAQVEADGEWLTSVELSGVEPGAYTVEADDGEATTRRTFMIAPVETPTPTATPTATPTETLTATPTETPAETTTIATDTTAASPTTTTPGMPGFGPIAVGTAIALLVSALLARRRNR
jgi:hypothetical protein